MDNSTQVSAEVRRFAPRPGLGRRFVVAQFAATLLGLVGAVWLCIALVIDLAGSAESAAAVVDSAAVESVLILAAIGGGCVGHVMAALVRAVVRMVASRLGRVPVTDAGLAAAGSAVSGTEAGR